MIRKVLLRGPAIIGFVVLTLATVESQVIGYVFSEARARLSTPEGPTPQEILSSGIASDGSTTLLAAGDIASCDRRSGFAEALPVTDELFGLESAFDPANAAAHETAALAEEWPDAPILALGDTVYRNGRFFEYFYCFRPT